MNETRKINAISRRNAKQEARDQRAYVKEEMAKIQGIEQRNADLEMFDEEIGNIEDRLAQLAVDNSWAGIVVHGCIRDSAAIGAMKLAVLALAALPRKSEKRGPGLHDTPVQFAGVTFTSGHDLYADADGVIVADKPLA